MREEGLVVLRWGRGKKANSNRAEKAVRATPEESTAVVDWNRRKLVTI